MLAYNLTTRGLKCSANSDRVTEVEVYEAINSTPCPKPSSFSCRRDQGEIRPKSLRRVEFRVAGGPVERRGDSGGTPGATGLGRVERPSGRRRRRRISKDGLGSLRQARRSLQFGCIRANKDAKSFMESSAGGRQSSCGGISQRSRETLASLLRPRIREMRYRSSGYE